VNLASAISVPRGTRTITCASSVSFRAAFQRNLVCRPRRPLRSGNTLSSECVTQYSPSLRYSCEWLLLRHQAFLLRVICSFTFASRLSRIARHLDHFLGLVSAHRCRW